MRRSGSASAPAPRPCTSRVRSSSPTSRADAFWEYRREAARRGRAARRLVGADPSPRTARSSARSRSISASRDCRRSRDQDLMSRMAQIAGIAIERRRGEDALRDSEAKFRGLFESVMEGVYRTTRDGRLLVGQSRLRADARLRLGGGALRDLGRIALLVSERPGYLSCGAWRATARCATRNTSCAARTAACSWSSTTAAWCATSRAASSDSRARSPTSPSARRPRPRCFRPRSARRSRCSRSAMRSSPPIPKAASIT